MKAATEYVDFVKTKSRWVHECGFECDDLPDFLFPFQRHLVEWALRKGRAAIFADCGLGKTAMQLAWSQKIIERHNKPILLLTPIAVGQQTHAEADRFGIASRRTRDGVFDGTPLVWITNYEQLHKYNPSDFVGVVCDESSAIKDFKSRTKATVVEFMRTIPHRLLCTATAAPNDYWELGTSSEALGLLGFRDMITTFFKQEQSNGLAWGRTKYRFRGHAEQPFWAWVCSWARSLRNPSDLGFDDAGYDLPELIEEEYIAECKKARAGLLFPMPGESLQDERKERRNSIDERCGLAAGFVENHKGPSVVWCELNDEGDLLEKIIPGSVQVSGSDDEDEKEEKLIGFSRGQIERLVIKPKLGAWGLNWQHCNHSVHLPSHSYEQYYQAIHRFHRFGQKNKVTARLVCSDGEVGILTSLRRKREQSARMFSSIVSHMKDAMHLATADFFPTSEEVPSWLA